MTGGGGGSAVATADGTNTGLSGNCNQSKEYGISDSKTFLASAKLHVEKQDSKV